MLESTETFEFLLTHSLVPTGPIPTAYDPDGVYPYESFCETSRRPEIRKYRMVSIESDLGHWAASQPPGTPEYEQLRVATLKFLADTAVIQGKE